MSLPQHLQHLDKANSTYRNQAAIRKEIAAYRSMGKGCKAACEILRTRIDDPAVSSMQVRKFLASIHRVNSVTVDKIIDNMQIHTCDKRLRDLTPRQIDELILILEGKAA